MKIDFRIGRVRLAQPEQCLLCLQVVVAGSQGIRERQHICPVLAVNSRGLPEGFNRLLNRAGPELAHAILVPGRCHTALHRFLARRNGLRNQKEAHGARRKSRKQQHVSAQDANRFFFTHYTSSNPPVARTG